MGAILLVMQIYGPTSGAAGNQGHKNQFIFLDPEHDTRFRPAFTALRLRSIHSGTFTRAWESRQRHCSSDGRIPQSDAPLGSRLNMVITSPALDVSDTNILQYLVHLLELVPGKNFKFSCERKFHACIGHAGFICLIKDL